jgi:accessory gene regulator protein AgrB
LLDPVGQTAQRSWTVAAQVVAQNRIKVASQNKITAAAEVILAQLARLLRVSTVAAYRSVLLSGVEYRVARHLRRRHVAFRCRRRRSYWCYLTKR